MNQTNAEKLLAYEEEIVEHISEAEMHIREAKELMMIARDLDRWLCEKEILLRTAEEMDEE